MTSIFRRGSRERQTQRRSPEPEDAGSHGVLEETGRVPPGAAAGEPLRGSVAPLPPRSQSSGFQNRGNTFLLF